MNDQPADHGLEFLLAFDGRIHLLEEGYWLKFEIKRVTVAEERPHGLSYSFTLHAPDGTRLVGFDNAHVAPARGSRFKRPPATNDHWHRTENDAGRRYRFVDADTPASGLLSRGPQGIERPRGFRNRRRCGGRKEMTE